MPREIEIPEQNCVVKILGQVEINMLKNISSDQELHDRMTKFWSMLLFVGALMSTMFFSGYVNPAVSRTCTHKTSSNFMGFMMGTGCCCGLAMMLFTALYTQYINAVSNAATRKWLTHNLWVMILPMFFLVSGIGCMSMVLLFVAGCTYDTTVLVFMFMGGGSGLLLMLMVVYYLSSNTGSKYADTDDYIRHTADKPGSYRQKDAMVAVEAGTKM